MALTLIVRAESTLTALTRLREAFERQAESGGDTLRLGRTCLQDAVPLTLRDTHCSQAAAIGRVHTAVSAAVGELHAIPLGGTVLGTAIGAPPGFTERAIAHLTELTGRPLTASKNPFDAMAHLDTYSALAAACSRAAMVMAQIAADLRWLSSGPRGGLAELALPALQPGSSIMPGKVNPVIPELVMQLSYRIRGAALTVDLAVAAGEMELNIMEPVIVDAILTILTDLRDAADTFAAKCIDGLSWNTDQLRHHLVGSLDTLVTLAATSGYEHAVRHQAALL